MKKSLIDILFGSKHDKDLKQLLPILARINALEEWALALSGEEFPRYTSQFKTRLQAGESLDDILPEAFALAREAARRTLGERPYDVQILGGIVLHQGKIMEMKTGEGKTLSSVAAAYLNALTGDGVHVITVNDYLAERDANWMKPVFGYLGLTVGAILANMDPEHRKQAYRQDITYGTNNEFGFDYLRDNMCFSKEHKVQRAHSYCIIDEIDSILVDEARTPLIISGAAEDDTKKFQQVNSIVRNLRECDKDPETGDYPEEPVGDYKLDEKGKKVSFTDEGLNHLEKLLQQGGVIKGSLFLDENFEYIHYATQSLKAYTLFKIDKDYVITDGKVEIVDEFTGRIMHGRRYSDGLHQAIEAKEGIRILQRNRTLATITFQNFFRMYDKISGMTGTAETEEKEFGSIYGLEVVVIPTNRPVARQDDEDIIFLNEAAKYKAICDHIFELQKKGQPVLVGTASIERSEVLSAQLKKRGIPHEVLNAKNHAREALIIAEAGAKGSVTIATNMAGRGTDIKLGGNPEFRTRHKVGTDADEETYQRVLRQETDKWRQQYQEIVKLGGLYILGTERHESRRIDNQLRGRAGRQGDPGHSQFFLSMDDDLMRLFGGGNMKNMLSRVGLSDEEPIHHRWISKSIERAQTKVEERNYEIRKHLLEYDDVLNEQRKFMYKQRDAILDDDQLFLRVLKTAEDILDDALDNYFPEREGDLHEVQRILDQIQQELFFTPSVSPRELSGKPASFIRQAIIDELTSDLHSKNEAAGAEMLNRAIRLEYLRNIDARWQDHLENLEALREAVYLRSYGQKNPLLEYKLEGFEIFEEMLLQIRVSIARKVFLVKADSLRPEAQTVQPGRMQTRHDSMQGFGGGSPRRPAPAQPGGKAPTVVRTVPKVGRNDLCPCGSGKKYKHCHGR
ncbi:preprotein translocase subunit SecA [Spirochaeta africana]|uniref:Protein translocase subunit SecA n=1 Tax=Spirochaeta africana (strain ATCC 700263 / DSM 8902 / Z-7692) TaxID=889378 RepID=H9UH82_SPIAZ|nr:preprotein translocase subunit SecA [Spirochaeta africana]AFG36875.1 preprotein translocase, SecA subunit [Spirochaeta africana DSM 8902]